MAQQDEGIMALAGGQQMEQQGMPPISRDDSYAAMQEALMATRPDAAIDMQGALSAAVSEIGPQDREALKQLLMTVEYINDNPEQYATVRQEMISRGMIDPEDFPEEFDPEFFASMEAVLREAVNSSNTTAAAEPPPEMAPPQGFAKGGIAEAAQLVAGKGRNGDTRLAHITSQEARLLRSLGGSGTINPKTGLPEFGFLSGLFKAVKSVVKGVVNVVKKVVSSPIGKIVATVALGAIIGPTALGMTLGTAGTAALSSGLVTAVSGGSLKDVLKSAAMGYLGSSAGPLAGYAGKATQALGISGALAPAVTAGLTTAGASLLTGQSLKDSVMSGLTSGVITGLRQAPAPVEDAVGRTPAEILGEQPMSTPQAAMDAATAPTNAAQAPMTSVADVQQAAVAPAAAGQAPVDYSLAGAAPAPTGGLQMPGMQQAPAMPAPTAAATPAPTGQALPISQTLGQTASGIGQVLQGDFKEGLSNIGTGLKETFLPSGEAGVMRTYGPSIAAGLGIMGAMGGFKQEQLPETEFQQQMRTPIDVPPGLLTPIQNLPGVQYDAQGNIIGSKPWDPYAGASMGNIRVATPGIAALAAQTPGYVPPPFAPGTIGPINQPYNTAAMYGNLQPRRFADGGITGLPSGGYPRRIGQISGPGTETSDEIPAMLSDGEFVMTARAVRGADPSGRGNRREGAKRMYALMHQLEQNAARG